MRKANDQCSHGSNWRLAAYDRSATRALIKAIQAATPGHVKFILFNDPQLIAEGLTRYQAGHDDHLHVHFCEAATRIATTAAEASPPRGRNGDYLIVRVPVIAPGWMVQKNV